MLEAFLTRLAVQPAVLVTVAATQGSVPRECGAWMAVFADNVVNTIGGGHLEFEAIAQARQRLSQGHVHGESRPEASGPQRFVLGPSLGQCCGGVVYLNFEAVSVADADALRQRLKTPLSPVALFGGGHVGSALVPILGTLPFTVRWIDSRDEIFPTNLPTNVQCEHSDPVHQAVPTLTPGTRVLIMSFSHAEDLDVVAACLRANRGAGGAGGLPLPLPFIGLIGSQTKWATFRHRLEARGFSGAELAQVTCPIGVSGIASKRPEVIAVAVAAQLLQQDSGH